MTRSLGAMANVVEILNLESTEKRLVQSSAGDNALKALGNQKDLANPT